MLHYPIKFEPILKEKIWGGNKLQKFLHKNTSAQNVGESWEISGVEGDVSIVKNGKLQGRSLEDLMMEFKGELVGEKIYRQFGNKFPLLIKFIDAKTALSIQLHPDDELASKRHNSFGKNEMWYVMQADENAGLIVGFKKEVEKKEYLKHLNNKTLTEILNFEKVKEGDVYFIPSGRVHAINAGVLLAEIQQTSDITYRIYDWDRRDAHGNYRELHTQEALDALDFDVKSNYKTLYTNKLNKTINIADNQYFNTNILHIDQSLKIHNNTDSFVVYMNVGGEVEILTDHLKTRLSYGETCLIPACLKDFEIVTSEKSKLLEVKIP